MPEKIVIEGNTVTLISETVKRGTTLENFLDELSNSRPALIDGIPEGCLAIASRQQDFTYFVFVPGHSVLIQLKRDYAEKIVKTPIFIPHSVWAINLAQKDEVLRPINTYWHFVTTRPSGYIKDIKAYQNFLPNSYEHNNNICVGNVLAGIAGSSPQNVINAVISAIENSLYTDHLISNAKYTSRLQAGINEFINRETVSKIAGKIETINRELIQLEKSDWANLSDKEINSLNTKRDKLIKERKTLMDQSKNKNDDWLQNFFPYLGDWSENNKEIIQSNPDKASENLLEGIFGYAPGYIRSSGDRRP